MLSAIQDFVRDSFELPEGEVLDELTAGEMKVLIETGPRAAVAAVVRGAPPLELRTRLLEALERIHAQVGDALIEFDGDDAPFLAVTPVLEDCLLMREVPRRRSYLAPAIITVALASIVVVLVAAFLRTRHRDQEWAGYVAALRAEPGIFVASSGHESGRFFVNGFRDPMARDPAELLEARELSPDDIDARWDPYLAPDPEFAMVRARQLLEPPDSVTLALDRGVLRARGHAPAAWIREARRLTPVLPGVASFDTSELVNQGLVHLKERCRSIEEIAISFGPGVSVVSDVGRQELLRVGGFLRALDEAAERGGVRVKVLIFGTTDSDSADRRRLAGERAQAIRVVLDQGPWAATSIQVGQARPAAGATGGDVVRFEVSIAEPGAEEEAKR
jgi:OOP family OmpA-OmpF porin